MRWAWTVERDSAREDLIVDADPEAAVEVVASAVGLSVEDFAGVVALDSPMRLVAPASGTVLPLRVIGGWVSPLGLCVRSGPLAGQVVPLRGAMVTVGRSAECDVQLTDPWVSRKHATLDLSHAHDVEPSVTFTRFPFSRSVRVNGSEIEPGVETHIGPDDLIELGASVMTVGGLGSVSAFVSRDDSGELAFNRPGRIRPRRFPARVIAPGARPEANESAPLPWAMAAVPVVAATGMAVLAHQPTMLLMAAASPVMVFTNYRSQKKTSRRRGDSALVKWQKSRDVFASRLREVTESERRSAVAEMMDAALVRWTCVTPGERLWERRSTDSDALLVRLGVAEREVPVQIDGGVSGQESKVPLMSPVPASVDLLHVGALGIAGASVAAQGVGRWVLLQLAALRSPRDLQLVVLCDLSSEHVWGWTRWLPHTQVDTPGAPQALIGNTEDTRAARVRELLAMIEDRLEALRENRDLAFGQHVVVLIDGARRYRTIIGMATVLRDGPKVGVYAICLDEDRTRLPEEVQAELVISAEDPTTAALEVAHQAAVPRLLLDGVSAEIAEECARALNPIRHVGGEGDTSVLPTSVRFVDLIGIDVDDPDWVASRWLLAGRTTSGPVGAGLEGPFSLDLKLDGPHALVAGTTGAGKSEFLQTFVVSLAIKNRPDAMNFVLVDYKGASAFADCERLPHTVGMVTNLDIRETERALVSLDAELKRREHILKAMRAKDVDDAWDRDPDGSAKSGLARLVVVIDEFAELVHELPDFVKGLIRIARVGRSLGIHLVLATQRPAGVVSAEMQANVSLRVGLRMVDKADSTEVLGSPESAFISASTPGRGYVRRGPGSAPSGFQTARVAGRRPGQHATEAEPPKVKKVSWSQVGESLSFEGAAKSGGDPSATDLHALVDVVCRAAQSQNIPRNKSPWLPALPETVTLASLGTAHPDDADAGIVLGLLDVPAEQAQRPLRFRVQDGKHLIVVGSARSGRSTLLRTVAAGLMREFDADDLHLYALDFGNGALLPLQQLPQCGAVISGTEPERVVRFLRRLLDVLSERQQVLAAGGFGDINEQRDSASVEKRVPFVTVLLDRWEGLLSGYSVEDALELREMVIKILREGPAVGVCVVMTGDRTLLTDRIAAYIDTSFILRMADRDDYRLAGIKPSALPEVIPSGRAYFGDPVAEVQFAVLSDDTSGQAQTYEFRRTVADKTSTDTPRSHRPFRLDVLPPRIRLDEASALPSANPARESTFGIVIGVGGDDLSHYRIDLAPAGSFLVAGQRQSGRSTALVCVARSLHDQHIPTLVVTPRPSPLTAFAESVNAPNLTTSDDSAARQLIEWINEHPRSAVIVDDADTIRDTPLDAALAEQSLQRPAGTFALVAAAPGDDLLTAIRGVIHAAKRHKQGLFLWPSSAMDGNAFGAPMPRALLGRGTPGRAALQWDGRWVPIQVPDPFSTTIPTVESM